MIAFYLVSLVTRTFFQYLIENFILICACCYNYHYFSDLDDTLYPLNSGLANAIDKNIKGKELCHTCATIFSLMSLYIAVEFNLFDVNGMSLILLDYMVEKLGAEPSKTGELVNLLYSNYGTTIAGLRVSFPCFTPLSLK